MVISRDSAYNAAGWIINEDGTSRRWKPADARPARADGAWDLEPARTTEHEHHA